MMPKLVIAMCLVLGACSTSYQQKGMAGGYTDTEVGENKYLVTFRGNGFTSSSKVDEFAFQRAKELCIEKGFKNFELISKNGETATSKSPASATCSGTGNRINCVENSRMEISKSKAELLVSCRN